MAPFWSRCQRIREKDLIGRVPLDYAYNCASSERDGDQFAPSPSSQMQGSRRFSLADTNADDAAWAVRKTTAVIRRRAVRVSSSAFSEADFQTRHCFGSWLFLRRDYLATQQASQAI